MNFNFLSRLDQSRYGTPTHASAGRGSGAQQKHVAKAGRMPNLAWAVQAELQAEVGGDAPAGGSEEAAQAGARVGVGVAAAADLHVGRGVAGRV